MIIRMLAMAGGIAGAATLSQYPEFAQQYTQRLSGQLDALGVVVADFDATAARSGLSRDAALAQMTGTPFLDDRRADMTRAIRRYEDLTRSHTMLVTASPMERLLLPHRMADAELFQGTWEDFVPAMPLSAPGAVAATAGYVGGWSAVALALSLLAWPFRRARRTGRRREVEAVAAYEDLTPRYETDPEAAEPATAGRPVLRAERYAPDLPPEPPLRRGGSRAEPPPLRRPLAEPGE